MSENTENKVTTADTQSSTAPTSAPRTFNREGRDNRRNGGPKRDPRSTSRGQRNSKRKPARTEEGEKYESKVIQVRRVTKVVKGGKKMKFSAMVVVGDGNGKIGFALRKGNDFQDAVAKASRIAQQNMFQIDITDQGSIAFPLNHKFKSSKIFLKPATNGTGLIAGGFIRPILELAGIKNVYSKILGSRNKVVGVRCVVEALENFKKTN